MAKIIGIDLGTTNSVVAIMEGGSPRVIPNQEGQNTTPSIVGFTKDGKNLVGIIAKRQSITNPINTVFSIKRFIGHTFNEVVSEEAKHLPYKLIKRANGDIAVNIEGKELTPQEISALILIKLKEAAESYLGQKVSEAVITVPAYFNDAQRQATKDAGKIAGLDVKRIVNEPTAAALAYGLDKKKNGTIAVFDFGGGTFDISVLDIHDGIIEVKSTNGDTHLGGDDIDNIIMNYLVDEFKKETGVNLYSDKMAIQRLKEAAEKAKVELSTLHEVEISLPYITADASGPKHLNTKISRAKFESICSDIFERLLIPCKKAVADAGISKSEIDEVLLVGGSTRIPKVQTLVKDFFGKEPNKSVNPDEVVAIGAAIQGAILAGEVTDVLLLDVTPLSLGIETLGGIATKIIERNTTIPVKKSQVFSTAESNQTAVDIHVVQGEREFAKDNKSLGSFKLDGIPAAQKGIPQIEVTFDIDANGIVNVSAKDKATGKEQRITITSSSGLAKEEIDRMIKEAQENAERDQKAKLAVEKRNRLDGLIFELEKTIAESKEKLQAEDIEKTQKAIEVAKEALKQHENDAEELQKATDELLTQSHKIAETLYKQHEETAKEDTGKTEDSSHDNDSSKNNGPIDTDAQ